MKSRYSAHRRAKTHGRPIPNATPKVRACAAGTYDHRVPIAILVIAAGLAPDGALAASTTTAGVRLQANAASTCAAIGSYTGVGVASGRGAVSLLTGGVINAAGDGPPARQSGGHRSRSRPLCHRRSALRHRGSGARDAAPAAAPPLGPVRPAHRPVVEQRGLRAAAGPGPLRAENRAPGARRSRYAQAIAAPARRGGSLNAGRPSSHVTAPQASINSLSGVMGRSRTRRPVAL